MSVVGGQPKKHPNPSYIYKTTKHIERAFLISDHYYLITIISKRFTYMYAVSYHSRLF